MNKSLQALLLLLSLTPAVAALAAEDAALLEKVHAVAQAFETGDRETLEKLLSERQVHINARGESQTRAELIELAGRKNRSVELADLEVERYDTTALVTGRLRFSPPGEEAGPWLRIMQVWIDKGGEWRRVGSQATFMRDTTNAAR